MLSLGLSFLLLLASLGVPTSGGVSLQPGPSHSVQLTWVEMKYAIPSANASRYNVYRADAACPAVPSVKINAAEVTATSYYDPPLASGSYCYAVTAVNSFGESALSATAGVTIP